MALVRQMKRIEAFRYTQLHSNEVAGIILLDGANPEFAQNMEQVKEINISMTNHHLWNKIMIEERRTLNESGETIVQDGNLGDIPVLILTATEKEMDDWQESYEELLEWSRNSKQVSIEGADHDLHHTHYEEVIKEIDQFLDQLEVDN